MTKISSLLCVFLLASCSLAPDYLRPDVSAPAWKGSATTTDTLQQDWWQRFKTPELTAVIAEAQRNNTDLRAGLQRIEQARAQATIARSYLFPGLSGSADLSLSDGHNSSSKTYGGGVTMSYEADLWRRIGNSAQAAKNRLAASEFDQASLVLMVSSETAQRYFDILALNERLRINQDVIGAFQNTLDLVNARFNEGAASGLEVSQQKIVLENTRAALDSIRQQSTTTANALAVLTGKPPQTETAAFKTGLREVTIPAIAPLQPASLLERRPDIRAQEEALKAANADIGVARAAIFPALNIGAGVGTVGNPTFNSFNLGSNVAATLVMNIFNAGRLRAGVDSATARQKELVETYRSAVLVAFRETEDALAAVKASQLREEKFGRALREAQNAYDIARQRYLDGADDFLSLLDAQRSLLQARENQVQARLSRLTAALDLFRALGGGWQSAAK